MSTTGPGSRLLRQTLLIATLWALATMAIELAVLPLDRMSLPGLAATALDVAVRRFISGLLLAGFALGLAPRLRGARLLLGAAAALLMAAGLPIMNLPLGTEFGAGDAAAGSVAWLAPSWLLAYTAWSTCCYGGALLAICLLQQRAQRVAALLDAGRAGRDRAQTLLAQTRFEALRARLDPQLLLRVLAEVERRYAERRPDAQALLDALIDFLRAQLPSAVAAPQAALQRQQLCSRLLQELGPERPAPLPTIQRGAI